MRKLQIIVGLAKWLYTEQHPNGVRFTINRHPTGESWFLVERDSILVPFKDCGKDLITVDGKQYARVGGGPHAGKYVFVGEAEYSPALGVIGDDMTVQDLIHELQKYPADTDVLIESSDDEYRPQPAVYVGRPTPTQELKLMNAENMIVISR